MKKFFGMAVMILSLVVFIQAQVNARMMQNPDVSKTHIVFSYGGDLWIVPKDGGTALKLSSPEGQELYAKFSPDGSEIAFNGIYRGNFDVYVMPSLGGIPKRVTHHGLNDRLIDWYPDGKNLLFVSSMNSGKQRFNQFYKVAQTGGLPEKLPVPYGEMASLSPDGKKIVYTPISQAFRTW